MISNNLHILTKEEIANQLYSMEVIDGKDGPHRMLSFLVPNKNYDPNSFFQEVENSEVDTTIEDTIKIIQNASLFVQNLIEYKNSKKWRDNHSKICNVSIVPMAMLIEAQRRINGRRDFCTEENINRIMNFSKQYGGIVEMM